MLKEAILLIDHGSRVPEANAQLEAMADLLRQRAPVQTIVGWAHMELCAPDIAAGFRYCVEQGAAAIVAFPYMLAAGRHVKDSIPQGLAAAAENYPQIPYRIAKPLGLHPLLAEIIAQRCGL